MTLTEQWIKENFDKFNQQYFNGELPTPNFIIVSTRTILGQCGAKNWRATHPNFKIKISNYFERTEHQYQNTLLHEMIHLYFQSHGDWKEGHGEKFQRMARSFDKYGWNIHTREEGIINNASRTIPTRTVMTFTDGNKMWLCCISPNSKQSFKRFVDNSDIYSQPRFFETNAYKVSELRVCYRRLGGRVISLNEFQRDYMPILREIG